MSTEREGRAEVRVDHNFHQLPSERARRWEAGLSPEYLEYRRRWSQNPQQGVVEPFPIHLDVEATSSCNLRCTMCPRTQMVEKGTFWEVRAFDFDAYTRLIDEGAGRGLASVKFNILGEPLMNPRIYDMIRYAKAAGLPDVMLNTNATGLTESAAVRLIESGLDKLFFSFDSPDREHYDAIRVNASYDKTLRNIRRFHAVRERLGSRTPFTRVAMVRMRENEHEWQAFKALFEPIVDAVAWQDYLDHSGQDASDAMIVAQSRAGKPFCCPQLWQRMFVHPDGVATPCCIDSARTLVMGNVLESGVEEIWNGPDYERMRDLHQNGRIAEIPTCASCPLALLPQASG